MSLPNKTRCFAELNRARAAYHRGLECGFEWEVLSPAAGSEEQLRVLGQVQGNFFQFFFCFFFFFFFFKFSFNLL